MCPAGCGQVVGPNTKTCPNKACGADVALLREKAGVKAIRAQKASQLPGDAVSSISKAALKAHARCMESAAQQAFSQQLQAFTDRAAPRALQLAGRRAVPQVLQGLHGALFKHLKQEWTCGFARVA